MSISPTDFLAREIKDKLNQVLTDKGFKKEVAQEVVFDIQRNARSGNELVDGKVNPMTPLESKTTIPHRKYLREAGNATARPYSDEFSNLSVSGQLIDSVKYEIDSDGITIFADDTVRDRYITKKGTPSKAKPITNAELASIHHKGDASNNLPARPFIGLRDGMRIRILVKMREYIRRKFY